jgi:flagellar biosynthetic protein FlhB
LAELRARGQWPRSPALVAAFALLVSVLVLQSLAGRLGASLGEVLRTELAASPPTEPLRVLEPARGSLRQLAVLVLVILTSVAGAVWLAGIGQGGATIRLEQLAPSLDRLNPLPRLARIGSLAAWGGAVSSVAMAVGAFALAAVWVWDAMGELVASASVEANSLGAACRQTVAMLGVRLALVLLFFGLVDYAWAWWAWSRQIRMTPAEQKAEHRELQGDPVMRGRRREPMRRHARVHPVDAKDADLVLLGPGRITLWLRRDEDSQWRLVTKASGPSAEPLRRAAERQTVRRLDAGLPACRLFRESRVGDRLNAMAWELAPAQVHAPMPQT